MLEGLRPRSRSRGSDFPLLFLLEEERLLPELERERLLLLLLLRFLSEWR